MSYSEDKERYLPHGRSKKGDSSSDSDSDSKSSGNSRRGSSSRTDEEDGGRSTPEERGNGYQRKGYSHSKKPSHESDRYRNHEKSRHVSSSSSNRDNHNRHNSKNDREREKRSGRRRSNSSSDESDNYNRRHRRRTKSRSKSRSRSRSRELKSKEREPRRNANTDSNVGVTQKVGDRRLFPRVSDDRSSTALASTKYSENETASWREGGPLPPPVFIGNQRAGLAPPPPNISGRVAPQPMAKKGHRDTDKLKLSTSPPSTKEDSSRSSFVPPSYLIMPPHPSSNALLSGGQNVIPPPMVLAGRPILPAPVRPAIAPPPALGHRPPPPPVRPSTASNTSSQKASQDASNETIINFHDAPKAPKKLPEAKPEMKRAPPKVSSGSVKNIAIKLGAAPKVKAVSLNQKLPASVASVFGADDSDSDEEMPQEAKMRMRNVGRETITSSGPNSFGKTRQGFTDTKKLYEKNMHKPLFEDK